MKKHQIRTVMERYDSLYRGGMGRGYIDEDLISLLAWASDEERFPTIEEIEAKLNKWIEDDRNYDDYELSKNI